MKTIIPKETHLKELHGHLLSSVIPRPIAFASTISKNGELNLAPFSYFNVFSAQPPILIFSPARSGRTKKQKDTYHNVKEVAEVVINMVSYDMVQQMSLASSPYSPDVDEFVKSGFTPIDSETIQPKRVKESPVQFECKVNEVKELGEEGGAGNLIICEVTRIHINEDILGENGMVDQHKADFIARMGGNYYCRASGGSLFEVEKPLTTTGIGFDQMPKDILNSSILTGNDLGKLGSVESLPNETDVNDYKLTDLSDIFVELEDKHDELELKLHQIAKELLENNKVEEAWKALLSFNNQ